jgi:hypothetical protein
MVGTGIADVFTEAPQFWHNSIDEDYVIGVLTTSSANG